MSFAEIEAELTKLTPDELRRLALKSWTAFKEKEGSAENECSEEDEGLLRALDDAVSQANAAPGQGHSADEVRRQISRWTSR